MTIELAAHRQPPAHPDGPRPGILEIFKAAVTRAGAGPAIRYMDGSMSYAELDRMSDVLATRLIQAGFTPGDRLALFLQNVPHFVIGLIAAWKAGGICVPINPMNLSRELNLILADATPAALIALDVLFDGVAADIDPALMPAICLKVSALEFQTQNDARLFACTGADRTDVTRFAAFLDDVQTGCPRAERPLPDDIAMIVYTSGTTGLPKGATISHGAFGFNAAAFCKIGALREGDAILGIAPLFHITGSVACLGAALTLAGPIVLNFRFEPGVVLDMIELWQPGFAVAAITAFIALYNHPGATRERLAGLGKLFSGGAPVPPAFIEQFEAKFAHYIHNCYGLTETASVTHATPFGMRAPVSRDGVLSIGRLAPGASTHIVDDDGDALATGKIGELIIAGPMVSAGYWRNADETRAGMGADGFKTGDMGFCDEGGWYYLVDRKKDVIISSGYKVWPREVEDVLYTHPAVREAAVVGIPDPYRGETVKAFVSLKAEEGADARELIAFCQERMAAYKYPRLVDIVVELPKSQTGKILRRALRP